MEINERIQEIRKHFGLSRRVFGEKLGVSESVIVNIEYDRLRRPEQKEPIYKLICEKFDVNEHWLKTGEGEMFEKLSKEDAIAEFIGSVLREKDDTFKKRYIQMLSRLDEKGWEALRLIGEMWIDMEKNKE